MNRIQLLDQTKSLPRTRTSTRKRQFVPANINTGFEHSFFVPLHYEANYAYPLVVWLHGPCDNHRQLRQVMPHVSMRNHVGVAVDSPTQVGDLMLDPHPWRQTVGAISDSMHRVEEAIRFATGRFNPIRGGSSWPVLIVAARWRYDWPWRHPSDSRAWRRLADTFLSRTIP